MLTPYDIEVMEGTVREIITMWNLRLTVLKPLPMKWQPNWNEHMHEYSGEIHYVQFDNVNMERKDQMITNTYNIDIVNGAGDQRDAFLVFTTSDLNRFIDETCRICYNGEQWRVRTIYPRIGESIIAVFRINSSDETWADNPDMVIDVAQMIANEPHEDPDYEALANPQPPVDCGECGICADVMPIGGDTDV